MHKHIISKLCSSFPPQHTTLTLKTGPKQGPTGFTVKAPARTSAAAAAANGTHAASDEEEEAGSDWETASEVSEEGDEAGEYEEWDPCVSLFDNKVGWCACVLNIKH